MEKLREVEGLQPTARMRMLLSKRPTNGPGLLETNTGEYTSTLLMCTHFPSNQKVASASSRHEVLGDVEWVVRIVTRYRIDWAIKSFGPFKSAAPDGVFPALLQRCDGKTIDSLII